MFSKIFTQGTRKTARIVAGISLFFALAISATPAVAHAQALKSIVSAVGGPVVSGVLNAPEIVKTATSKVTEATLEATFAPVTLLTGLVRIMGGFVLALVSYILGFIIDLNFNILNPDLATYKFIATGWSITRDIANLGFVLFIILIALATIVRFQDYEAKRLLPKLIAAAILVNFSLAIPTVLLNFTNVMTNYFLDRIGDPSAQGLEGVSGSVRFAVELATLFKPQSFILTDPSAQDISYLAGGPITGGAAEGYLNFSSSMTARLVNMIFLAICIFVIGTLAILFVIRFVWLSFLLAIAPITWLTWVIPGLEGNFSSWWKKFMQHAFFMPLSIFCIYLVILTGDGFYAIAQNRDTSLFSASGVSDLFKQTMMYGSVQILLAAFMIGSLIVGQKLSIEGAGKSLSIGKSWANATRGWAKKRTLEGGKRAASSSMGRGLAQRMALSNNAVISSLGKRLHGTTLGWAAEREKQADKNVQKYTGGDLELAAAFHKNALFAEEKAGYERMVSKAGGDVNKDVKDKEEKLETAEEKELQEAARSLKAQKYASEIANKIHVLENDLTNKPAEITANNAEIQRLENEIQTLESKIRFETDPAKKSALERQKTGLEGQKSALQTKDASLNKELKELGDKLDGARKEYVRANAQFEKALDSAEDAAEKKGDAAKNLAKAQTTQDDFNLRVMQRLDANTRNQLKSSNFDLSKTNLAGSRKAKDKQIPELQMDKLQKEMKRLADEVKKADDAYTNASKPGSFAKPEEIAAALEWKNKKSEEHTQLQMQVTRFKTAQTELENSRRDLSTFTTRGGSRTDPRYAALLEKMEKAEKNYWRVAKFNPSRPAGFNQKGKGGKKEDKDDDE